MKSRKSVLNVDNLSSFKRVITLLVVLSLFVLPTFAAGSGDTITELDNWAEKILELFQSSWVKAILLVALIVEAIGLVIAGQQGGGGAMIRKFFPWVVGTLILLSASSICSYFLKDLSFEVSLLNSSPLSTTAVA